jgi:hypothetical protein
MYDKTRTKKASKEKTFIFKCENCGQKVKDYKTNRRKGRAFLCSAKCRAEWTGIQNSIRRGGDGVKRTKKEKDRIDYAKHVERRRARQNSYYWANREKILAQKRTEDRAAKEQVVKAYGGKCECCGESTIEFLTIDHINGDGALHRRRVGKGRKIYKDLIRLGFPKDNYRLLCFNCNIVRGFHGYCPHHPEEKSSVSHTPFNPGRKRTISP